MLTALLRGSMPVMALMSLIALGCSEDKNDIVRPGTDSTITQLDWDTSGGGDLHFEVMPADPGDPMNPDYQVDVLQCEFQAMDLSIDLTPQDGDVYALVDGIFKGTLKVGDYTFVPSGLTGTWTSIGLNFDEGDPETIDNIDTQSDMRQLYQFVHAAADAALAEPSIVEIDWDTSGGGDLHFTIIPSGLDYQIDVDQYGFQSMELTIDLVANDGAVYTLVDDIFHDRIDVHDYTFVPGGATGTWTSITLAFDKAAPERIANIDLSSDMGQLYQFVHDAIEEE